MRTEVRAPLKAPLADLGGDLRDEFVQRLGFEIILVAVSDGDGAFLALTLADDGHERDMRP